MVKKLTLFLFAVTLISCAHAQKDAAAPPVYSGILTKSMVWQGTVVIEKDLLIPEDAVVTINPGTTVLVQKADISRTEPVFLMPETEIVVQGKLIINGTPDNPVFFKSYEKKPDARDWGGIILQSGALSGKNFVIWNAYTGLTLIKGAADLESVTLRDNSMGIVVFPDAAGSLRDFRITGVKTGLILNNGNIALKGFDIFENEEGMIVKAAPARSYDFKVYRNLYGIIIKKEFMEFFLRENKVYENKNNVIFTDGITPLR